MKVNCRKIVIAITVSILSVGWIFPLMKSFQQLCSWLYFSRQNTSENIDSGVVLDVATGLFNISMSWLAIVIFLWSFYLFFNISRIIVVQDNFVAKMAKGA